MAALHLVNRPAADAARARCLASLGSGDTVLFYESGVLGCTVGSIDRRNAQPNVRYVALRADVERHGVAGRLDRGVAIVDDLEFVDLVASHKPIVSWI